MINSTQNSNTRVHETPWRASEKLLERVTVSDDSFSHVIPLEPSDREYQFIKDKFDEDPPLNRVLLEVSYVYNENFMSMFEKNFPRMEKEALSETFQPAWKKTVTNQRLHQHREETLRRFNELAAKSSPCSIPKSDGTQQTFHNVKVLFLFQGTNKRNADSIKETGLTYFGKQKGAIGPRTDGGFFGSGIYGTPSLRYADGVYSEDGTCVGYWIAAREPYPVVKHNPSEGEMTDMQLLFGKNAYDNFNCHYVPVVPGDINADTTKNYYPCRENEAPEFEEVVVFQNQQTLVGFIIKLGLALPDSVKIPLPTVADLMELSLKLAQHEAVKQNASLCNTLLEKAKEMKSLNPTDLLNGEGQVYYIKLKRLISSENKLNEFTIKLLMQKPMPQHSGNENENRKVQLASQRGLKELSNVNSAEGTSGAKSLPARHIKGERQIENDNNAHNVAKSPSAKKAEPVTKRGKVQRNKHGKEPVSSFGNNFVKWLDLNYRSDIPYITKVSAKVERNINGGYKFVPMNYPKDYVDGAKKPREPETHEGACVQAKVKIIWEVTVKREGEEEKVIQRVEYFDATPGMGNLSLKEPKHLHYAVLNTKGYIYLMKAGLDPRNQELYREVRPYVDAIAAGEHVAVKLPGVPNLGFWGTHYYFTVVGRNGKVDFSEDLTMVSKTGKSRQDRIAEIATESWVEDKDGRILSIVSKQQMKQMYTKTTQMIREPHSNGGSCEVM